MIKVCAYAADADIVRNVAQKLSKFTKLPFRKTLFFTIKLLHANVFIVKVKYQITASKAVVGVDRPVSAHLRINVENLHKKLSKFIQLKFCQNIFFFKIIFLHAHARCVCIVKAQQKLW